MRKIILLFILGIILISGCKSQETSEVKEFSTVISGYTYNPSSIKVNLGDTVRINIKNNDKVGHGISLPAFGVRESVSPGGMKTIQFIASQRGAPETFCSTDHGEKLLIEVI